MSLLLLFNQPSGGGGGSPLSRTVGTRVSSNGTAVTSGSMVIPDNSLVVLITKTMRDTSDVSPLTITNSGAAATWTQQVVTPSQTDQYSQRIWFHTAYFTTGGTFTFTATAASAPPGGFAALTLLPIVYENANTTLGVSGSANNGPTDGAWSPSLSGAPAATSDVLAAYTATVSGSGNLYQTDGSGVTRLDTANAAGVYGGSVSVRTGSTTASYTWDDVLAPTSTDSIYLNSVYAALEIKQASGGATTHATSGALTGQGSTVAGTAAHIAIHGTTGALTGQIGSVSGTAARFRAHPTSGALAGQGATIAGSAARSNGATTHDTTGALTGSGSAVAGTAARLRAFSASGALTGQGSAIVGTAQHNAAHATSGALTGSGSAISGTAARVGTAVTHATSGALVGAGAVVSGIALNGTQQPFTNEVEIKPRRYYVRKRGRLYLFNSAAEADAWIEADEAADKAIEQSEQVSKAKKKRIAKLAHSTVKPVQVVDIEALPTLADRFSVSLDLPKLIDSGEFDELMRIRDLLIAMQDEEDVLLLLMA